LQKAGERRFEYLAARDPMGRLAMNCGATAIRFVQDILSHRDADSVPPDLVHAEDYSVVPFAMQTRKAP